MNLRLRLSVCLALGVLLTIVPTANAQKFGQELKLDHFWFYSVEPVETKASVSVKGQFDKDSVPVSLPSINFFANPVSKDGGRLINPMAHLTWYKLLQRLGEPKRAVEFRNQFGIQEALLGRPVALLVPTEKVEKGSKMPERLDHYKVYEVLEAKPLQKKVTLKDQFGSQEGATAAKTVYFCVPVMKKHGDTVSRINNEKGHLTIYLVRPEKKYGKKQDTVDQFGKHTLAIGSTQMLALPTVKIAWKAIED